MTMTLIETKTLGTAAASIEFTSIPQDGTDLFILISARNTTSGASDSSFKARFNSNASGYTSRVLYTDSSNVSSFTETEPLIYGNVLTSWTANTFGNASIYVPNYAGSTNKSFSVDATGENNATRVDKAISAHLWSNTEAITSFSIVANGTQTFAIGTTVSLYKVTKGSDGIVTTS